MLISGRRSVTKSKYVRVNIISLDGDARFFPAVSSLFPLHHGARVLFSMTPKTGVLVWVLVCFSAAPQILF